MSTSSQQTTVATLDLHGLRETLIDSAAEKRGIDIGMCLAAAMLLRDFDRPSLAREILDAAGIDAARVKELELDDYDSEPLLEELASEAPNGK